MVTLHIEHAITDYPTWKGAFDRFAPARREAGVRGHRIRRPVDDPRYVVIDLDFDTADAAVGFLGVLRERVWSTPANSPALADTPEARILAVVDEAAAESVATLGS